jgi:hypothetical protein
MLHVGMNIPDKSGLAAQVARVLKPGRLFGIYDVMRTGPAELTYPVPWASTPDLSALAVPETYKAALQAHGFEIVAERSRREFALEFFRSLRARMAQADGPPPLGLHLVMGPDSATKVGNMLENIEVGTIAPVEIIARRAM